MSVLDDFFRYENLIKKVTDAFHSFRGAKVNETVMVPEMVVDIEGKRWRIPEHPATREK